MIRNLRNPIPRKKGKPRASGDDPIMRPEWVKAVGKPRASGDDPIIAASNPSATK